MINTPPNPRRFSILRLFEAFIRLESSGGLIMIGFAGLALLCANSSLSGWYNGFISLHFGGFSLSDWVKDVLMVLFFLSVGLELKHEMVEGLLSRKGQVVLPLVAAIGGMAAPALIFAALNHSSPETLHGWAIPSATDIAFALCVLMLFGASVPSAAKILLLAIAIFDDLGAILIIAFFYGGKLALMPLMFSAACMTMLFILNRFHVSKLYLYILVGIILWFALHAAGIHTTIAGVAVGLAVPLRHKTNPNIHPLGDCLKALHPFVAYGVLPLFAFVSAGVDMRGVGVTELFSPLPLGIALGLFAGKQIGIFGSIALLVRTRLAPLPEGMGWLQLWAVSALAGIGFTMSLFISLLAYDSPHLQDIAKIGVIAGSLLSAAFGSLLLLASKR